MGDPPPLFSHSGTAGRSIPLRWELQKFRYSFMLSVMDTRETFARQRICPLCGRYATRPLLRQPLASAESSDAGLILVYCCSSGHIFTAPASIVRVPKDSAKEPQSATADFNSELAAEVG